MGIIRRLVWTILLVPTIALWIILMWLHWLVIGKDGPLIGLSEWMDNARAKVLGKED